MSGWLKRSWQELIASGQTHKDVDRLEQQTSPTPLFLARQPILNQVDWQNMLHTNRAGNITQNMAASGNQEAALLWGRMLLTGQGTKKDVESAFTCFQKALHQMRGNKTAAALNMLGRCYEHGWGVVANLPQAFACYRQAAEQGDAWAMFNLADCYRKGIGCQKDLPRAHTFYERAANKGHVKSLNMLGLAYEEGSGVEQNLDRAAELFAKGAKAGDCWASFNHARLLALQGKWEQSLDWLERSLEQQSGDYCQTFAALFITSKDERLRSLATRAKKAAQQAQTVP